MIFKKFSPRDFSFLFQLPLSLYFSTVSPEQKKNLTEERRTKLREGMNDWQPENLCDEFSFLNSQETKKTTMGI